ncbi:hypothetical protein PseBG33_4047 [Pseudomonas synxantha BG33R]|nr:hypothetical protein PseBG33_4047 [Pseudomonas synxantha BG33R]
MDGFGWCAGHSSLGSISGAPLGQKSLMWREQGESRKSADQVWQYFYIAVSGWLGCFIAMA